MCVIKEKKGNQWQQRQMINETEKTEAETIKLSIKLMKEKKTLLNVNKY